MNTPHVAERAVAYWSGELSSEERAAIEAHVALCAECRAELADIRTALGAVASWPANPVLDAAFEQRILARLPASNTSRAPRATWRAWQIAAAIVIAFGFGLSGFALGRVTGPRGAVIPAADSTLRSYLLLLEEPVWPPAQSLTRSGYGDWARAISAENRYVEAEKLTDEPGFRVSGNGQASRPLASDRPPNVSGWYVIKARSYDEAISWARRGPHLAYGSVLVREIENTPRIVPRVQ